MLDVKKKHGFVIFAGLVLLGASSLYLGAKVGPTKLAMRELETDANGLPAVPRQDFEKRYDQYSPRQQALIKRHVETGLSDVGPSASEYEKVAALNAYIYRTIERREGVYGGGVDILTEGGGVCGGMVTTLSEMLYSIGTKSRYAFTIGGPAAHSMAEVSFSDGTAGLFDPYHGIAYYDTDEGRPVSITEIDSFLARENYPVLYALKRPSRKTSSNAIEQFYSAVSDTDRRDYSFFRIFAESDSKGIANSGFLTTIRIALTPGDVIGTANWKPSASEPRPWSRLSIWKRTPEEHLSWAYILGQTSQGYRVQHAYSLGGLVLGQRYRFRLYVANAYVPEGALMDHPAITIQPVSPFTNPEYARLKHGGYSDSGYKPQVVELSFEAERSAMTFIGHGTGDFVVQGIELVDTK